MEIDTMPAVFLGHGSPMNALESNRFTEAWRSFGASIPRPRAVLAISAHWYIAKTAVTAMARPQTIHDFGGFPKALFEVEYAAPGDPALAEEVVDLAKPTAVALDEETWGLDHGTWSVLVHVFPDADVPVVQLAIDARQPSRFHFELGAKLAPLRERGVLILCSGDVVHNLRAMDWSRPDAGSDWAERFDAAARAIMTSDPSRVLELEQHPDYRKASPTPDHFLPLVYFAGVASAARRPATVLVEGCAFGAVSMTSFKVT